MAARMANRLGEFARFIKFLPRLYRGHVLDCQRRFQGIDQYSGSLFFDRRKHLVAPNDVATYAVWQQFFSDADGSREVRAFLRLAAGCRALLDVGAAQGLFSAVFARSRDADGRIVAVEPTEKYRGLHEETARLNGRPGLDWQVHLAALSDKTTHTTLGSDVLAGHYRQFAQTFDLEQALTVQTLDDFCRDRDFTPDLVKMDIDSFEAEVLAGSPEFLARHRPKVHLELHPADLRRRGKDPGAVMESLLRTHVIVEAQPTDYLQAEVARLGLVPKPRPGG